MAREESGLCVSFNNMMFSYAIHLFVFQKDTVSEIHWY